MATIDTSTIEGFDAMSAEDKVNALLAYNYPDVDMSKFVTRETFDKKASEAAKLARDLKDVPAITAERDKAKADLAAAMVAAENLKRENLLYAKGITDAEDVKYYAYRIGQMVSEEKTFEKAAEEFFKENAPHGAARVDLGASLAGGGGKKTPNDIMNALLRGAK